MKESPKEKNTYRTTNFHIAVWLLMNEVKLLDIEWADKRAEFIFEEFENGEQLIQEFFKQDQLQKYISGSQKLKARMYAFQSPRVYE